MQLNQADSSGSNRVGVDEHLIQFKPSPNFKNMKKYIRSRSDTTMVPTYLQTLAAHHHPPPSANIGMDNHHLLQPDWHNSEVQPPLPLGPPPPDDLPSFHVKQEIVDTEYEPVQVSPLEQPETTEAEHQNEIPSKVCRDFIRGTCKREGLCKYAHKYDLSQLEGVYTFCRKFQNSVCTFTNCKYVHATVFEEQHFYRTGILPAHALHHKKNNVLQPPPPPPPEEHFVPFNIDFSNPPPPLPNNIENPMISCVPTTSSMDARPYLADPLPSQSTSQSSLKRGWNNVEPLGAPPCDLTYNEQLPKKCKHCDIMEFRLEHNKNKLKKILQSKEQLVKKMALLNKQSEKLRSLISELMKPPVSSNTQSHSNNVHGDKDKTLLEHITAYLSGNSRLSTLGEDQ